MTKRTYTAFMLLCLACQAQAEPLISTSYDFYPIAPANRHDIRNELQNKSPAMNAGRDFIGYTDWRVHLSFHSIERQGICSIGDATVTLLVKYTLPRLDENYFYDWATESSFNRYYAALLTHEQGHAESGTLAALELQDALGRLHSHRGCAALSQNVDASFDRILEKYRQRDLDYDRRTDHGRSQGADLSLLP